MILDGIDLQEWDIEILATDVNSEIVSRASEGLFTNFEMQRGLTPDMLRYFKADGDFWRISDHLRERVRFGQFNLQHAFESLGVFDIIFCRNVLMYFDADAKRDVLTRLQDCLVNDGYLALGANETVLGATSTLDAVPGTRGIFTKALREMRRAG